MGQVNNVLCYFQKQCSDVKYLWAIPIVPAFPGVSFGICHVISWVICVLFEEVGVRALRECGAFRQTRTATFFPYFVNVYLFNMTRSIDALHANFVRSCTVHNTSDLRQLLIVVFCLDDASLPLVAMLCTVCVVWHHVSGVWRFCLEARHKGHYCWAGKVC